MSNGVSILEIVPDIINQVTQYPHLKKLGVLIEIRKAGKLLHKRELCNLIDRCDKRFHECLFLQDGFVLARNDIHQIFIKNLFFPTIEWEQFMKQRRKMTKEDLLFNRDFSVKTHQPKNDNSNQFYTPFASLKSSLSMGKHAQAS